jgi:hypothetical protein
MNQTRRFRERLADRLHAAGVFVLGTMFHWLTRDEADERTRPQRPDTEVRDQPGPGEGRDRAAPNDARRFEPDQFKRLAW